MSEIVKDNYRCFLSFHATLWLALHDAWAAHQWELGWSAAANFGLGEPASCFYPPLSPIIGAALSFLLPFRLVPGVVIWLIFAVSGFSMFRAAAAWLDPRYRLLAALLYMFNPYLLTTLLFRGSIAEAWVQAVLPLAFLLFYRVIGERRLEVAGFAICLLAAGGLCRILSASLVHSILDSTARFSICAVCVSPFALAGAGDPAVAFRGRHCATHAQAGHCRTSMRYLASMHLFPQAAAIPAFCINSRGRGRLAAGI